MMVPKEVGFVMNRPFSVLIADDEKPVASALQAQLETLGYDVVAIVHDGQHAIEVCRRSLPDVVLMDIEMPGLDGLSAARQIVKDPGTPVIILTSPPWSTPSANASSSNAPRGS
jgi:response regulator NasT